jgi:hypothetical protein
MIGAPVFCFERQPWWEGYVWRRCYTRQCFVQLVSQFCCAIQNNTCVAVAARIGGVTLDNLALPQSLREVEPSSAIVAKRRTWYYFSEQLRQLQQNCEVYYTRQFLVQLVSQQSSTKHCLVYHAAPLLGVRWIIQTHFTGIYNVIHDS